MKMRSTYLLLITIILSCSENQEEHSINRTVEKDSIKTPIVEENLVDSSSFEISESALPKACEWDSVLINFGLTNIKVSIPDILVELKYSDTSNFMNKDVYGCLENCYLQPSVVHMLKKAQEYLRSKDSSLTLLVYDGVRPRQIQQIMWDIVDLPIEEKTKFVSNPKNGSLHNYGAAVDITVARIEDGQPLDMGAPYDHIGILAWPIKEKELLEEGRLLQCHIDNRKKLRRAMSRGGFFNIQSEWWHFNAMNRQQASEQFEIVEGI